MLVQFAPYLTMLLNGAFWDSTNPRIMSDAEYTHLKQRLDSERLSHKRFLQVADVSADWGGGLQFVKRPSTISDPAFFINQHGEEDASSATKNSTSIMSIEILPSELPEDASAHFSNSSLDYLRTLCQVDDGQSAAFKERSVSLDNAHLITAGQLTMPHAWLKDTVATSSASATRNRKVVLFGSGYEKFSLFVQDADSPLQVGR